MRLTDVESSFPVEIAAVDGEGEIDVAGGVDARHDAHGAVLVDILADHVLRVEAADDAPVGTETGTRHVDHHAPHHVATLGRKHQRLCRVNGCPRREQTKSSRKLHDLIGN